jgi:hypothetical protein
VVELRLDWLLRKNLPYKTVEWEGAMADLGRHLGRKVGTFVGLREIEEEVGAAGACALIGPFERRRLERGPGPRTLLLHSMQAA